MSRPNTLSTRIEEKLAVLTQTAKERCMYKVHEELRDVNEKAYKPVLLAIGPYNDQDMVGHGFMKEHKLRYLKQMLVRTKTSLETYIKDLRTWEEEARKYYAECPVGNDAFVEMMLLDGCFIIELFHRYKIYKEKGDCQDDPIFQLKWVLQRIARDLLLFENQLPFIVLLRLFITSEKNLVEHIIDIEKNSIFMAIHEQLNNRALGFFSAFLPFKWNDVNNSTEKITYLLGLMHEAPNPSLPVMICERLELGFRFKYAKFNHLLGLIHATICISILDTEIDHAKERQEVGVKFKMAKIFKHPFGLIGKSVTSLRAKEKPPFGASLTTELLAGASLSKEPLLGASLTTEPLASASLSKEPLYGASLTTEPLVGANLSKQRLRGASLTTEPLVGASLSEVPLTGASLSEDPLAGFEDPDEGFSSASIIQETIVEASLTPDGESLTLEKWKHLNVTELLDAGVEPTKACEFVSKLHEICRWIKIPCAIELQEADIEFKKLAEIFYAHLLRDQNGNIEQKSELCETGMPVPGIESKDPEKLIKCLLRDAGIDNNKVRKFERLREIEQRNIHGATELEEAGIKFKKAKEGNSFSIKFNNGIMEISPLSIVDETETCLRNLIAYEQYYDRGNSFNYVTNFVCFMDDLINSPKDVDLLRQSGIIRNYLGDDEVISTMVNKLGHNLAISPESSIYARTSVDLNIYCSKPWNRQMAKLRHDYFNSPWALVSFLAALLLLALTIIQTIFSIIP